MLRKNIALLLMICAMAALGQESRELLVTATGIVTMLSVEESGRACGPLGDRTLGDVVVRLDREPTRTFSYCLGRGDQRTAALGMLDLLADAYENTFTVELDYTDSPAHEHGYIRRVWLTKPGYGIRVRPSPGQLGAAPRGEKGVSNRERNTEAGEQGRAAPRQ